VKTCGHARGEWDGGTGALRTGEENAVKLASTGNDIGPIPRGVPKYPIGMWRIPLNVYRSGTSRGLLFLASDLESVPVSRNEMAAKYIERGNAGGEPSDRRDLIAARLVGSGHPYGVDGLGGGRSSTSKSIWVKSSDEGDCHVDCKFVQSRVEEFGVDDSHGDCGNMIAALGPFAIEKALVEPVHPVTKVRVRSLNTGTKYEIEVQTKVAGGNVEVQYCGDFAISGIEGTAAPVKISAFGMAGGITGKLLPTGRALDVLDVGGGETIGVSCLDFSRPMVMVRGSDVGMTGLETKTECDNNSSLNERMERIRRQAARLMGMGNVENQTSPKICALFSPRESSQTIRTRYFTDPRHSDLHYALAMTAAQCIAASCLVEGTLSRGLCNEPKLLTGTKEPEDGGREYEISIGHPSGSAQAYITVDPTHPESSDSFLKASYVRTVRPIITGEAFYPLQ